MTTPLPAPGTRVRYAERRSLSPAYPGTLPAKLGTVEGPYLARGAGWNEAIINWDDGSRSVVAMGDRYLTVLAGGTATPGGR